MSDTKMAALLDVRERCKDGRYQHWMNFSQEYKEGKYTKQDLDDLSDAGLLEVTSSCGGGDCYLITKREIEALKSN